MEKEIVTFEATLEMDSLRSALLSGLNTAGYWARDAREQGRRPGKVPSELAKARMDYGTFIAAITFAGCTGVIAEHEGDRKIVKVHAVTLDDVKRGLALMIQRAPHMYARVVQGGCNDSGDLLLQYAIFGEEKYS